MTTLTRAERVADVLLGHDADILEFSRSAAALLEASGVTDRAVPVATLFCVAARRSAETQKVVSREFGAAVAALVHEFNSLPWASTPTLMRKRLAQMSTLSHGARLIALASTAVNLERAIYRGACDWERWRVRGVCAWHRRCLAALTGTNAALEHCVHRRLHSAQTGIGKKYRILSSKGAAFFELEYFYFRFGLEVSAGRSIAATTPQNKTQTVKT